MPIDTVAKATWSISYGGEAHESLLFALNTHRGYTIRVELVSGTQFDATLVDPYAEHGVLVKYWQTTEELRKRGREITIPLEDLKDVYVY